MLQAIRNTAIEPHEKRDAFLEALLDALVVRSELLLPLIGIELE